MVDGLGVVVPQDGYQGGYIADIAQERVEEHGEGWLDEPGDGGFRARAEERIFADIRRTLDSIGIVFDVYSNENELYDLGRIEEVLVDLRAAGHVYDEDDAVWFRATAFGLDRDRVLVKRTGEPPYLTPDIAYHREKFRRDFERIVDVQGADHKDQFPFVQAGLKALQPDSERAELAIRQFVTVTSGGRQVEQSAAKAAFITTDAPVDETVAYVFRLVMDRRGARRHPRSGR